MGLFDEIKKGIIRGMEEELENKNSTMKKNALNVEQTKKTTSDKQIGRNSIKKCVNCGGKFGNHIKVCPNCGSKDFTIEFNKEKVDNLWKEYDENKKANPEINMNVEKRLTRKEELAIMNNYLDKQYKLVPRIKIYREIPIVKKNKNPGMHTRPERLTDIIGGMYGNTAISMKTTYTPPTSTVGTKWEEDELLFNDDGFTILSSGQTILYENISDVTVDKSASTDKGLLVYIDFKNSENQIRSNISFRTHKALDVKVLIKDKIAKQNTSDISEENSKNKVQPNTSNMNELMKYAELYEKGLLTEEEFTALKKKLLGL